MRMSTITTTTTTTKSTPVYARTTLVGMPSGTSTVPGDCDRDDDDSSGLQQQQQQQQQAKEETLMTAQDAQRRIHELESQVRFYKVQSTGAAEKLTEYDHEVRRLRSQASVTAVPDFTPRTSQSSDTSNDHDLDKPLSPTQLPMSNGAGRREPSPSLSPRQQPQSQPQPQVQPQQPQPQPQTQTSRLFNFTSFLPYGRRPSATPPPPPQSAPPQVTSTVLHNNSSNVHNVHVGPDPEETKLLQNALNREQNLRKAAENQLTQANTELEDLTAQLFLQANEMVAQERKERAKLEERVAVLERRDVEKRKRLDRLEKAMQRVERLRSLVG